MRLFLCLLGLALAAPPRLPPARPPFRRSLADPTPISTADDDGEPLLLVQGHAALAQPAAPLGLTSLPYGDAYIRQTFTYTGLYADTPLGTRYPDVDPGAGPLHPVFSEDLPVYARPVAPPPNTAPSSAPLPAYAQPSSPSRSPVPPPSPSPSPSAPPGNDDFYVASDFVDPAPPAPPLQAPAPTPTPLFLLPVNNDTFAPAYGVPAPRRDKPVPSFVPPSCDPVANPATAACRGNLSQCLGFATLAAALPPTCDCYHAHGACWRGAGCFDSLPQEDVDLCFTGLMCTLDQCQGSGAGAAGLGLAALLAAGAAAAALLW